MVKRNRANAIRNGENNGDGSESEDRGVNSLQYA